MSVQAEQRQFTLGVPSDHFEAIANLPFNICHSFGLDWQTVWLPPPIQYVSFINLLPR